MLWRRHPRPPPPVLCLWLMLRVLRHQLLTLLVDLHLWTMMKEIIKQILIEERNENKQSLTRRVLNPEILKLVNYHAEASNTKKQKTIDETYHDLDYLSSSMEQELETGPTTFMNPSYVSTYLSSMENTPNTSLNNHAQLFPSYSHIVTLLNKRLFVHHPSSPPFVNTLISSLNTPPPSRPSSQTRFYMGAVATPSADIKTKPAGPPQSQKYGQSVNVKTNDK